MGIHDQNGLGYRKMNSFNLYGLRPSVIAAVPTWVHCLSSFCLRDLEEDGGNYLDPCRCHGREKVESYSVSLKASTHSGR